MSFFDEVLGLYSERGAQRYEINGRVGGVTQLQHALQCAALAVDAQAPDTLVAAALLHDLGHLLVDPPGAQTSTEQDDVHEYRALPFLRPYLPAEVLEPIRLHVEAKRYLCSTVAGYWDTLSEGSKRSLALQGGPLTDEAAQAFIQQPHAAQAVQLRRWDDRAKDPSRTVPAFETYRALIDRLLRARPRPSTAARP